jgi:hypothetical protein
MRNLAPAHATLWQKCEKDFVSIQCLMYYLLISASTKQAPLIFLDFGACICCHCCLHGSNVLDPQVASGNDSNGNESRSGHCGVLSKCFLSELLLPLLIFDYADPDLLHDLFVSPQHGQNHSKSTKGLHQVYISSRNNSLLESP